MSTPIGDGLAAEQAQDAETAPDDPAGPPADGAQDDGTAPDGAQAAAEDTPAAPEVPEPAQPSLGDHLRAGTMSLGELFDVIGNTLDGLASKVAELKARF
jgi:hypothetical protein